MPEDQAFNLLSYILNFHFFDEEAEKIYKKSKLYDEGDIYFYFDPNTQDEDYPKGLVSLMLHITVLQSLAYATSVN